MTEIDEMVDENEIDIMFVQEVDVRYIKYTGRPLFGRLKIIPQSVKHIEDKRKILALVSPKCVTDICVRRDLMSASFALVWIEHTGNDGVEH